MSSFWTFSRSKPIGCGPCQHIRTKEQGTVLWIVPAMSKGTRILVQYASGNQKWLGSTGFHKRWVMLEPSDKDVTPPSVLTSNQQATLARLVEYVLQEHKNNPTVRGFTNTKSLVALLHKLTNQKDTPNIPEESVAT